jgi:hypothetical protein
MSRHSNIDAIDVHRRRPPNVRRDDGVDALDVTAIDSCVH